MLYRARQARAKSEEARGGGGRKDGGGGGGRNATPVVFAWNDCKYCSVLYESKEECGGTARPKGGKPRLSSPSFFPPCPLGQPSCVSAAVFLGPSCASRRFGEKDSARHRCYAFGVLCFCLFLLVFLLFSRAPSPTPPKLPSASASSPLVMLHAKREHIQATRRLDLNRNEEDTVWGLCECALAASPAKCWSARRDRSGLRELRESGTA